MKTQSVLVVGAGPSGLSLSALAAGQSGVAVSVLEGRARFEWHPGMMLTNARMQSSALKDLVTPVDPANPFGFLSFLKSQKRLYSALVNGLGSVSRQEFEAYLQWVAQQQPDLTYGEHVREVTVAGGRLRVRTDSGQRPTKNLAISVGKRPFHPPFAERLIGPEVIHSKDFIQHRHTCCNKRVAVIGGGQSGAEIVLELLTGAGPPPAHVTWISRRSNLFVLEDSPFVNEWFHPAFHTWYRELTVARRKQLLQQQRMASDGISQSTLAALYDYFYQSRVTGHQRLNLLLSSTVRDIRKTGAGVYQLDVFNADCEGQLVLDADVIVLATGYKTVVPDFLDPLRSRLEFVPADADEEILVGDDFGTDLEGVPGCRIFVQNGTRLQHGIANPNMALTAMRSALILNSVSGRALFDCDSEQGPIDWRCAHVPGRNEGAGHPLPSKDWIGAAQ